MSGNPERIDRVCDALRGAGLDAYVSTLAVHVLMLSGYWPVIGTSFAIAARDGTVALLVPEDEKPLTNNCWANVIESYSPSGLQSLRTPVESAVPAIGNLLKKLGLSASRLGYESGPVSEPSSYAAMHLFGASILHVLDKAAPGAMLQRADDSLETLSAVKTPLEVQRSRHAAAIAGSAFEDGCRSLVPGKSEAEVADHFRRGLSTSSLAQQMIRADGFVYCMSGENSAHAYGAFAHTSHRRLQEHDLILMHCNSYADGYWTDITRTYVLGEPTAEQSRWRNAVMEARSAAFTAIAPGAHAKDVDRAARDVLQKHGLADLFRHSTGHGVGFAAISANAMPRLHPHSPDILEPGMVFNVEPALYKDGVGGMRHCDLVAVTENGMELLTPFQCDASELALPLPSKAA